jgi:sporulation protein YlmC with PRC-barrel domain
MKSRNSAPVLAALILALAAGTTASALARSPELPPQQSAAIAPGLDFRSSQWLCDRKVVNNNAEEIANVSDLILDRGSGRIEYLVIKTGTTLGMGGRAVAIPFAAFRWDSSGTERFMLASTPEQLKQYPEYTPEGWKALKESPKDDKSTLRHRLEVDAASAGDPYAGGLDTAKSLRIEGEIKKVERVPTSTFGEQVVITVQPAAGTARRIALGPSWFVNGASAAPMRGDKVIVDTLALPRDPDQLLAGTHLRNGDLALHLRDTDGTPAWSLKTVESGKQIYSTPYSRYLLLSLLPGTKVDCRGNECGKIHDVILDRHSGVIGFLSIDPNQNFLGISDTKRLVPWSVATVMLDGGVRIDASKDMVLASPETPADLSALNSGTVADRAYKAYDVPAPRFEAPRPISAVSPGTENAWSASGSIIGAIERDSARSMAGKVIDVSEIKFKENHQPARALRIQLAGDGAGEEIVVLGPVWYLDNQKPICKTGDSIKLEACRTTIDGHAYWMARSVECKDARVVMLDANNTPAWAQP